MNIVKTLIVSALVALPVVGFSEAVTNVTWKKSVSLGASYKGGNTDKSLFTVSLKGDRYAPESDWINSLYTEYGETSGDQTEGQVRGQSNYRKKFSNENMYGGIFAEAYHDALKDLDYRVKVGPNVGYYFVNNEERKFDASIGLNYVHESQNDIEEDYAEYRLAANYIWEINANSTYYCNLEYTINAEETDDNSGLLVTGLRSKVSDALSMFIEFRDEYDNMPAPGIEYNDTTVLAGLNYDF